MSNSKNYNSIFFLTTLSVYLGLVLVGATPSVLAQQAALTQKFEIQNEREIEDDLDKNPDDDESINFEQSLESYFKNIADFVEDLKKLHQIEKFDLDYDEFEINEFGFIPCNVDGDPIRRSEVSENVNNYWLLPAIIDAKHNFSGRNYLADCLKNEKFFKKETSRGSNLKISYDTSELKVEVSIIKSSNQRADYLAEKFNQASKIYKVGEGEIIVKKIYANTSYKSENNQVFIVTNLPRASIDELLADKSDAQ